MLKKSHVWFTITSTPYLWLLNEHLITNNNINPMAYVIGSGLLIVGSKFPDIDLKLKKILPESLKDKRYYYHRQFTHSILLWILISFFIYSLNIHTEFKIVSYMFIFGVLTHLVADMLTGTIPVFFYGTYRKGAKNRIGISSFFPWKYREIFTKSLPKWLDKNLWIFLIYFMLNVVCVFFLT